MAVMTKKCYYSNTSKFILFYFYSSFIHGASETTQDPAPNEGVADVKNDYKCKFCNMTFSKAFNLKIHQRIHISEKPFKCKVCQKRFSQNSTLKFHMAQHAKKNGTVKNINCEICDFRTNHPSELLWHVNSVHEGVNDNFANKMKISNENR